MSKLTGLPKGPDDIDSPEVKKSDGLQGLPEVTEKKTVQQSLVTKARICKQCGKEARIVSNSLGIRAYCNPCKLDWAIAASRLSPELSLTAPRGLRKETLVEPDWDKAYD